MIGEKTSQPKTKQEKKTGGGEDGHQIPIEGD